MVAGQKKAMERLWRDSCTVYIRQSVVQDSLTAFREEALYEDIPCKLSFKTFSFKNLAAAGRGNTAQVSQGVKLFLSREYEIPAGARIEVVRDGKTLSYHRSGEPEVFAVHQEVPLELVKERA